MCCPAEGVTVGTRQDASQTATSPRERTYNFIITLSQHYALLIYCYYVIIGVIEMEGGGGCYIVSSITVLQKVSLW